MVDEVIEKILKTSLHDTEVNLARKSSIYVDYDRFTVPSSAEATILEIRVTRGKRYGYSSTTDLTKWRQCLRDATKIMQVSKPLDMEPILPSRQKYMACPLNKRLWSMGQDEVYDLFYRMFGTKFRIISANISKANSEDSVANSDGLYKSSKSAAISASIEVKYRGASSFGTKVDKKPFDTAKVLSEAEEFCMKSINPKAIKAMVTDAVLEYFSLSALLGSIMLPAFYADRVQSKESFLLDKMGQKIFSDNLTMFDDGTAGPFSGPCDHEGVMSSAGSVVKRRGFPPSRVVR